MTACAINWPEAAVWIVVTVVGTLAIMFLSIAAYIGSLPNRERERS